MAKTIRLIPVATKYVRVEQEGVITEVWKVDPKTGQAGTPVPYNDAVRLLCLDTPVVSILPTVKDGKFETGLTPADQAKVNAARAAAVGNTVETDEETAPAKSLEKNESAGKETGANPPVPDKGSETKGPATGK